MDLAKDKLLCEKFPNLYRDRYGNASMCWGFDVGDGWFELIYNLSEKLEKFILALPEEERINSRCFQVKEKFGLLRFYMDGVTDEMEQLINEAERASSKICEDCGAPGEVRGGGYIRTLCDNCG